MKYTYFLTFGKIEYQIIPDKDVEYKWDDEEKVRGFKRREIGDLVITRDYDYNDVLINEDAFNTLWSWWFDVNQQQTEITLTIKKNGVVDYNGVFMVSDGKLDVNNGVYTLKTTTNDAYKILLSKSDEEVDIISRSEMTTYSAVYDYETVTQTEVGELPDQPPLIPPLGTWVQVGNPNDNIWKRQKSAYEIDATWTKAGTSNFWYKALEDPVTKTFEFPNCHKLTDTIQFMLDQLLFNTDDYGLTFVSEFFNNPINYVTGLDNDLMNILIEQRTDAKDPTASNKAAKGYITWNDLMETLYNMFNVRWFIDGNGDLRIEHQKYFDNGLNISNVNKQVCIDLTDANKYKDPFSDKLYIEDSQSFEIDESHKTTIERLKFADADTYIFRSDYNYFEYDVLTDSPIEKVRTITIVSTDVKNIINNAESIADDGFVFFHCSPPNEDKEATILGRKDRPENEDDPYIINAYLSTKWLLYYYWTYGRPYQSATFYYNGHIGNDIDSITMSFNTTLPSILQKDISFLLSDDDNIDINMYIATYCYKSTGTEKAYGTIINISHDLETDFVTATLGYSWDTGR